MKIFTRSHMIESDKIVNVEYHPTYKAPRGRWDAEKKENVFYEIDVDPHLEVWLDFLDPDKRLFLQHLYGDEADAMWEQLKNLPMITHK